jgi:Asp-tRNA(Asn)/Glu-tRNA(Gln) amidotransferase A subunit family amidase
MAGVHFSVQRNWPARLSLPNGFSSTGLPIGVQIVGRQNDEAGIIALAAQFEEACPWKDSRPPID